MTEQDEGYQEGFESYAPPIPRLLNILPYSGENVLAFANTISKQRYKARYHPQQKDRYFEKDRLFLFKKPPPEYEFDSINPGCDCSVEAVMTGKRTVELMLEILSDEYANRGNICNADL